MRSTKEYPQSEQSKIDISVVQKSLTIPSPTLDTMRDVAYSNGVGGMMVITNKGNEMNMDYRIEDDRVLTEFFLDEMNEPTKEELMEIEELLGSSDEDPELFFDDLETYFLWK